MKMGHRASDNLLRSSVRLCIAFHSLNFTWSRKLKLSDVNCLEEIGRVQQYIAKPIMRGVNYHPEQTSRQQQGKIMAPQSV